jgi:hypothetical protein
MDPDLTGVMKMVSGKWHATKYGAIPYTNGFLRICFEYNSFR